jgi:uncharacterized protein (DUF362 family)
MIKVVIVHNENIEKGIEEALSYLPVESLIKDKIVAVKPNETWASNEDKTAVTQPDTLRGVLQYVKKFNSKELIVTGGSGAGETREIMEIAGLMEVVNAEKAEFFDHNKPSFESIPLKYAPEFGVDGPQKEVMVNPKVLEYETLISLSQLKVHETATVTLGMKNIAMSYPAADYYGHPRSRQKHPHQFFEDMHSFIAAMAKRFPIKLSIIVGHPAMVGTGPIGGHTFETGLVIASTDPLAADVVGARILGFKPEAVGQLKEAGILGVGETNIKNMEFPALSVQEAVTIFSKAAYGKNINLEHA